MGQFESLARAVSEHKPTSQDQSRGDVTSGLPANQTQPQFVGSTAFNETLTSERLAPPDS